MKIHTKSDSVDYSDVTVVIKTMIRYRVLIGLIDSIKSVLPDISFVVIDDTPKQHLRELNIPNVQHVVTEPDIGVSAGRNLGFRTAKTKYVLYTDDDHVCKTSLEQFSLVFDHLRSGKSDLVGWLGGLHRRVNARNVYHVPTRGHYEYTDGFLRCDQTAMTFVAVRDVLLDTPFVESIKTNGEHSLFFAHMKAKGVRVFDCEFFNWVNLDTKNKHYDKYRRRNNINKHKKVLGYRISYAKHQPYPAVLIIGHKTEGQPWLDELRKWNPTATIHISTDDRDVTDEYRKRTVDSFTREWWRNNKHLVKEEHLLVVTHDIKIQDRLPIVKRVKGVAAKVLCGHKWPGFKQSSKLPTGLKPIGCGPYNCVVYHRNALDCISDPKWDDMYMRWFDAQLRTPTILASSGYDVNTIPLPDITHLPNISRIKPSIYGRVVPGNTNHPQIKEMYDLMQILKDHGVTPFLAYGSALHAHRDGTVARHFDNDMDLGVFADEWTDDVRQKVSKSYATLTNQALKSKNFWGKGAMNGRGKFKTSSGKPLDLFPYAKVGDYYYVHVGKRCFHKFPAHMIDEMDKITLAGYEFNIPKCPDYLKYTYGENWAIERRKFDWATSHKSHVIKGEDEDALIGFLGLKPNDIHFIR